VTRKGYQYSIKFCQNTDFDKPDIIPVLQLMLATGIPPTLQTLDIRDAMPLQVRPSAPTLLYNLLFLQ
jgi:hypothetical protein